MTNASRQELKAERDAAWRHCVRQYYIQCAKTAIKFAPLPEFKDALGLLEFYDECPTKKNREHLKKVYRELRRGRSQGKRDYGYSAVGEFYYGLRGILYLTIHMKGSVMSSSTQRFAEAHWCATRDVSRILPLAERVRMPEERTIHLAGDKHQEIWKRLFDEFHEKYGASDKEYYEKKAAA